MTQKPDDKPTSIPSPVADQRQGAQVISMQTLRAIGRGLRQMWDVPEETPDSFLNILKEVDDKAAGTNLPPARTAKLYVLGSHLPGGKRNQDEP